MSSRIPHNGTLHPHIARTGDGTFFPSALSETMEDAHDGGGGDGRNAIRVLKANLDVTPRQAEVLHWIAEGKTNAEIATILGCSFFTVKAHIKVIFQRLGVHSRTAAAACAYRTYISHSRSQPPSPVRAMARKRRNR